MTLSRKAQKVQVKDSKDAKKFFSILIIATGLLMLLAYLFYSMNK